MNRESKLSYDELMAMAQTKSAQHTPRMPYCPCTQETFDELVAALRRITRQSVVTEMHETALSALAKVQL